MMIQPDNIVLGERDENMTPSVSWVTTALASHPKIKMIVVTNPDNPTGTVTPKETLNEMARVCGEHNVWLILDNTYEYFVYDETNNTETNNTSNNTETNLFHCVEAPHVINIFSFSKAYGMMGWRQGYLTYIDQQVDLSNSNWSLEQQLLKCQDTIPICPTIISQHVALGALAAGKTWVGTKLKDVVLNQQLIRSVLEEVCGEQNVWGGQGAIYFFVRLPEHKLTGQLLDDIDVVTQLALKYKVVIIPGSACGCPGYVRVSYANLRPEKCVEAAERLRHGLDCVINH